MLRSFLKLAVYGKCPTNQTIGQYRCIKRWVAPTIREINKRRRKMGPEAIAPRSNHIEWNYSAELFAFGKRLNEEFDLNKLQVAFIHRSYILQEEVKQRNIGIEEPEIKLEDNRKLVEKGEELVTGYLPAYLNFHLPKVPEDGLETIYKYLTSEELLAHISSHMGTKDIVLCGEFPPSKATLRNTLMAVIGALEESSGEKKAYDFIRDFICTHLNQKDLMEIWQIEKPLDRLKKFCEEHKLCAPEPRLIGEIGKNTILAAYQVGIYTEKKLIGKGFGESIQIAADMAALDALRVFYGIHDDMKPFDFNIKIERIVNKVEKIASPKARRISKSL